MAKEVLAAETAQWEQTCPRLRLSEGAGRAPHHHPVIVSQQDSPQHHLVGI